MSEQPHHSEQKSAAASRTAAARQRYAQLRERAEAGTAGQVRRRVRELELMNHALIMASLSLTLLIPALVTVSAFLPLGSHGGVAAAVVRRLGLSAQATKDVQQLFPTRKAVSGSITTVSAIGTMFFAVGWPAELQRSYQAVWELPSRGIRDMWRAMVWLVSFFGVIITVVATGSLVSGLVGALLTGLVALPLSVVWTWWTQYLLLGGRIGWRALLPGAVATSLGLFGFTIGMHVYLPIAITENSSKYGPIGVLLALLSWIIGFSAVMLGGPLVGHTIYLRRLQRLAATEPDAASTEPDAASTDPAAGSGREDAEVAGPTDRLVPP
jgi:membrane protein